MKTFTFDLNVSAWVKSIEIEAENKEEAMEKLNAMDLDEIVDEGVVKNFEITSLDVDYDPDQIVEIYDITYDIGPDELREFGEDTIAALPTEMTTVVNGEDYVRIDKYFVEDYIFEQTGVRPLSFEYDVSDED